MREAGTPVTRARQAARRAERAQVLDPGRLWSLVFAEVAAWQQEHGGGDNERGHADRIFAELPPAALTGYTNAERAALIRATVARLMDPDRTTMTGAAD
jgi:hypothetical protein